MSLATGFLVTLLAYKHIMIHRIQNIDLYAIYAI